MQVAEDHLLTDHTHDGSVKDKMFHMKSRGTTLKGSMQRGMKNHTTLLTGVATGIGFGLGLWGRMVRRRHGAVPHIVIIEGTA